VVPAPGAPLDPRSTILLPGVPDGSYSYAQVDALLGSDVTPRLFVEYVGQADSDKPAGYRYSTVERADLVEARWALQDVRLFPGGHMTTSEHPDLLARAIHELARSCCADRFH
jgi:pimeloyl-ACP methyl ester carboxylesterase